MVREWPWLYHACRIGLFCLFRLWFGLRVAGSEHIPDGAPFLVVSNHESFLDPMLIGSSTHRRVRYLARSTLWKQRLFGALLDRVGALPIERGGADRSSVRRVAESLAEGIPVVVFPEGTRGTGSDVAEFRRGVMLFLRQARVPVLPVGIRGSGRAWPRHAKWIRPWPIRVRFGALIPADDAIAMGPEGLRAIVARLKGDD